LSPAIQHQNAIALVPIIQALPLFIECRHLAVYCPIKGEMSPLPILELALRQGKHCYLPVIHPDQTGHLAFVEVKTDDPLTPNRFGILEPVYEPTRTLLPEALDVVLTPLVAFDNQGRRLGTGGGYYDRTFSFLKRDPKPKKPALIGLAYAFQHIQELPEESWDILLTGILTENQFIPIP